MQNSGKAESKVVEEKNILHRVDRGKIAESPEHAHYLRHVLW